MSELDAGYDVAELVAEDLEAVYDVVDPSPLELVAVLERLGYTVRAVDVGFEQHGLEHGSELELEQRYRVSGLTFERALIGESELAAVVRSHADRVAAAAALEAEAANEDTLRSRIDSSLGTLANAWQAWPTLSPAQKDGAMRLTVRVTLALARLEQRRLESTD